jgi:hypothetical protein
MLICYCAEAMPWYNKERPTPFDHTIYTGLKHLHGDVLAQQYGQEWVRGKKYPVISFPSGIERELQQSETHEHVVQLFGDIQLPYQVDLDNALEHLHQIQTDRNLVVVKHSESVLMLNDLLTQRGYFVAYDNAERRIADITRFPEYAMELLDGEVRAVLPPLYANERKGLEAVAPIKFFTPDSNWTWYPTEFDGDDTFFGLVSGFEVELGYFSLSELESVRGSLGLFIERDWYFSPATLAQLQEFHQE